MPLSDTERRITEAVVRTFVLSREAVPRLTLVHEFQDTNAIGRLLSLRVIATEDGRQTLLPTVLAFHYCGKDDLLQTGKRSVQMMIRTLQILFHENWDNPPYTPKDVRQAKFRPMPDQITLGLYLLRYIPGVLINLQMNKPHTEVTEFRISEDIVNFKDVSLVWDNYVRDNIQHIEHPATPLKVEDTIPAQPDSRKVFVVHGRDNEAKHAVARFLERLNLHPVILHEQPNKGLTIIEKFEANSDVAFAVVLLTPDDTGKSKSEKGKLRPRARQNVVFELGFFFGRLGRRRVCALHKGGIELPSDVDGVIYVPYDEHDGWKTKLAQEIKECGINIDMNRIS